MPQSLAQKLKIKEGFILYPLHAPDDFEQTLAPLPEGVKISAKTKKFQQLHWFVQNRAQLEKELDTILSLVTDDIVCWTYYPKGSSKIQTDLTRDKGWEKLLAHTELQWISLISFNETWSAFGFRLQTGTDKSKAAAKPKEREIFQYADPATKTIRLPDDFADILKKDKQASNAFNQLSFSNKKEYVEWIITAKRLETRNDRLSGSLERLLKGWKNPANRG